MDAACLVRCIRRELKVSQRGLAALTGVSRSTIERIEAGRTTASLDTLAAIAERAGFELVLLAEDGRQLVPDDAHDALRQRDGRRFPAHLPWHEVKLHESWWGWFRIAWWLDDPGVPAFMFWRPWVPPSERP